MPDKTRITGNLVSDNNLFVNPTSDNTGIGTTNPTSKLHVVGNVLVTGIVTAPTFSGTATTATNVIGGIGSLSSLTVSGVATVTGNFIVNGNTLYVDAVNNRVGILTAAPIQPFQVGSGSSVVTIDSLGEVGIGTTNPTSKLQVIGDANITGVVTATSFIGNLTGTAITSTNVVGGIGSLSFLSVSGGSSLANVFSAGIVTATSFVGSGRSLTDVRIGIQSGGNNIGFAGTVNFTGLGVSSVTVSSGIATVNIPGTDRKIYKFTATEGQTSFSVPYGVLPSRSSFIDVFLNGVKLSTSQYILPGSTVELVAGTSINDIVEVVVYDAFDIINYFNVTDYAVTAGLAYSLSPVASINTIGVITATSFSGDRANFNSLYVSGVTTSIGGFVGNFNSSGISTANTLFGNSLSYTSATISSGIVTDLSGSNLSYSGIATVGFLTSNNGFFSGIVTANTFRPSSGYIQAADGTNSFYIYDGTGNVAFQGTIGASQINNASGYKAIEFGSTTTPLVIISNNLNVGAGGTVFTTFNNNIGIGTTTPSTKLTVIGDSNISGFVSATSYYGKLKENVKSVNTNYAIQLTDSVILASNTITITMPTSVGFLGDKYYVKNVGVGTVTIVPQTNELIDSYSQLVLGETNSSLTLISDNSKWLIF